MRKLAVFPGLALVFTIGSASAETLAGQATVIDGDTIEMHGERIRLAGIDAPESRQTCLSATGAPYRCGHDAAFALADRIGRATVTCDGGSRDRYRRLIATCFAGVEDLNQWMVLSGLAVAYRKYSQAYVSAEDAARNAKRGLWGGAFEMPWDWRKAH